MYEHSFLVFPQDKNGMGTLFGGKLLAEMDICAAIAVRRLLYRTECDAGVTRKVNEVNFDVPAYMNDLIIMKASIVRLGKSSIDVQVKVKKEGEKYGNTTDMCEALFTFVAIRDGVSFPHGRKFTI